MKGGGVVLRSRDRALVPFLLHSTMDQADVNIITVDGYRYLAHSCILSASPVLKSCLKVVDVRVSGDITIYLDFTHVPVKALINFLYKGSTEMKRSFKPEFTKLCKSLRLNPTIQEIHPATYEDKFEELNPEVTVPSPDSTVFTSGDVGHSCENSEVQSSNSPVTIPETDEVDGTARPGSGTARPGSGTTRPGSETARPGSGTARPGSVTDEGELTVIDGEGDNAELKDGMEIRTGEGPGEPELEPARTEEETQSTVVLEEEEEDELPEVDLYSDLTLGNRSRDPCTSSLIGGLKAKPPEAPQTEVEVGSISPPSVVVVQDIVPVDSTPDTEAILTRDSVDNGEACQEEEIVTDPTKSNQIQELKQPLEEEIVELTEDPDARTDPVEGEVPGVPGVGRVEEVPGVPGVGRVEEVGATWTESDVPETCFFCDICYQIFVSSSAMNKHRETEHKDEQIKDESSGDESPVGVAGSYADKAISGAVKDVSYDETPESISDFLNELNKTHMNKEQKDLNPENSKSNNNNNKNDADAASSDNDDVIDNLSDISDPEDQAENLDSSLDRSENEFRMPENFDIPQDYIQEIVPKKRIDLKPEERIANLGVPLNPLPSKTSVGAEEPQLVEPTGVTVEIQKPMYQKLESKSSAQNKIEAKMLVSTKPELKSPDLIRSTSKVPLKPGWRTGSVSPEIQVSEPGKPELKGPREEEDITYYYSRDTSSKSTKSTKRLLSGDHKRNRKRQSYVAELFGECSQESEGTVPDTPKVRREFETCGGTATILADLTGQSTGTPGGGELTPAPGLLEELQDKKDRVKKRLMETDSDKEERPEYKEKRKKKKKKKLKEKEIGLQSHTKPSSGSGFSHSKPGSHSSSHQPALGSKPGGSTTPSSKHTSSLSQPRSGSKLEIKPKAPFKFEDDFNWLVPDSYEDSSDSEKRKERKRKKKKKQERSDKSDRTEDQDSSEEDERRKRLDERKQKRGGDVLAWMSRRAKVAVKYQEHGRDKIVDKAIYIMNLIGSEEEDSSGVEQELKTRKRDNSVSDKEDRSRSSSPHHKRKKKSKKRKRIRSEKYVDGSGDENTEKKKLFKRSISLIEEKKPNPPPIFQRSASTFGSTSFKIPKLSKPKPDGEP